MKFAFKVFITTVVVVAICFAFTGWMLIDSVFDSAMDAAVDGALDKNRILSFGLVTAAANIPVTYDELPDSVLCDIADSLEEVYLSSVLYVSLSSDEENVIYSMGRNAFADAAPIAMPESGMRSYRVIRSELGAYIQVVSVVELPGREIAMQTQTDISGVFTQRDSAYSTYRKLVIVAIVLVSVIMLLLSYWLTRPVRALTRAARHIERGDLDARTQVKGRDELGQFAASFDAMADSLQYQIKKLENEDRAKEDFIASFAHELKTPLTSIIGYSDMLRSRDMEPRDRFTAANYIFSEGRRLQSLSLKLMDMIILRRTEPELRLVNGRVFLNEITGIAQPSFRQSGIKLKVRSESAGMMIEPDLMKTLVLNILDNARKASEEGGRVELYGQTGGEYYDIIVRDFGRGIPESELSKITEAFYMVDKSRSRAQNGAGLGLAICAEIAAIHGTTLEFKSDVGQGTAVRIRLKGGELL